MGALKANLNRLDGIPVVRGRYDVNNIPEKGHAPLLPDTDNTPGALAALRAANLYYRNTAWPAPFDATDHRLNLGDARNLSWIADNSVHLIVTSPPYWTLKKYETRDGQLGDIAGYEDFLTELGT